MRASALAKAKNLTHLTASLIAAENFVFCANILSPSCEDVRHGDIKEHVVTARRTLVSRTFLISYSRRVDW